MLSCRISQYIYVDFYPAETAAVNCCRYCMLHDIRSEHALPAYLAVYTYVDFYPAELLRYCVLTDIVHDMWRFVMYCCTREYSLSGRRVLKQRGCVRNTSKCSGIWYFYNRDALRYDDRYPRVERYGCITSTYLFNFRVYILLYSSAIYIICVT